MDLRYNIPIYKYCAMGQRFGGFTWLSLAIHLAVVVMSSMVSFVPSFFSRDVLGEIWDLSQFLKVFLSTLSYMPQILKRYQ